MTDNLFKHVVHENVEDGCSMIGLPLVIAEQNMPGTEHGPLGWHTRALTKELQEVRKFASLEPPLLYYCCTQGYWETRDHGCNPWNFCSKIEDGLESKSVFCKMFLKLILISIEVFGFIFI